TLNRVAHTVMMGSDLQVKNKLLIKAIYKIDPEEFKDKRVVIKGCGENPIPEEAYLEITNFCGLFTLSARTSK
ncbi:MAG: DUF2480 family protein, partial [Crocinitomicaceae bacterium]|nr:DUF2480 family protein [Crocinitomicaceae bacterium]